MDLEPTTEQTELRAGVAALLARHCPTALVRSVVEDDADVADITDLRRHSAEQGWYALTLPEDAGGLGLGPVELAVLAEETGRAIAPLPWLSTVGLAAPFLAWLATPEQQARVLASVAEGRSMLALAATETETGGLTAQMSATATRGEDGWRLRGSKLAVVDAATADTFVTLANAEGRAAAFLIPAASARIDPQRTVDRTRPWASVTFDCAAEPLGEPGNEGYAAAYDRACAEATLAVAAETLGVTRRLLEASVEYAKVRQQFGVPIGSFQAVKHKLADAHLLVERARGMVAYAALAVAETAGDRDLAVAAAKVATADAATHLARESLQTHGGIGYTWEHDLQLGLKRARTDAVLLGTAAWHRQRVADLLELPKAG